MFAALTPELIAAVVGGIVTVVSTVVGAVATILNLVRTKQVHAEIRPPSNNVTLGALVEAQGQKQDMATGLLHPDVSLPSTAGIARELQQAAVDAGMPSTPTGAPPPPPPNERRVAGP